MALKQANPKKNIWIVDDNKLRIRRNDWGRFVLDIRNYKTAAEMKRIVEIVQNKQVDIDSRVEAQLRNIFNSIETFANKGRTEASAILLSEVKHNHEIYNKVAEILEEKGYQVKLYLDKDNNHNFITTSWE